MPQWEYEIISIVRAGFHFDGKEKVRYGGMNRTAMRNVCNGENLECRGVL